MGSKPSAPVAKPHKGFRKGELSVLDAMFSDLAARSPGPTMDKFTFLKFFNVPGMLGERLFAVFDKKKDGVLDFEEFLRGMADFSRGTIDQKIRLLFNMYDLTGDGFVSRVELSTVLHSLVTWTALLVEHTGDVTQGKDDTVTDIVKKAFKQCDLNADGLLSYQEFKKFTEKVPSVVEALEMVFLTRCWSDPRFGDSKQVLKPMQSFPSSSTLSLTRAQSKGLRRPRLGCGACGWQLQYCYSCGGPVKGGEFPECRRCGKLGLGKGFKHCMQCSAALQTQRESSIHLLRSAVSADSKYPQVAKQGIVFKRSNNFLSPWKTRWFVIHQNFLYYSYEKDEKIPRRVQFLPGCFIEIPVEDEFVDDNYFGFEIIDPAKKRVYYVRDRDARQGWVRALRKAAKANPIREFYRLGKQIGKGKFSVVLVGSNLRTGAKVAVKVIDKGKMTASPSEKEALRTEMAILRLVDHPNIIKLHEIFESRTRIYLVMQFVRTGDLFDRIIKYKCFSETVTKQIVWKLLSAVKYLHARGIVHRDIKPENILCQNTEDNSKNLEVLIADFGLSKFARPTEMMKLPCGTLCYVAPEVLKLQGYSKAVDLWSIGIITYLLIRGGLPFDGDNKREIISRTLHGKVSFKHKRWNAVTPAAKDFVLKLLQKNPLNRASLEEAQHHKWFDEFRSKVITSNKLSPTHSNAPCKATSKAELKFNDSKANTTTSTANTHTSSQSKTKLPNQPEPSDPAQSKANPSDKAQNKQT